MAYKEGVSVFWVWIGCINWRAWVRRPLSFYLPFFAQRYFFSWLRCVWLERQVELRAEFWVGKVLLRNVLLPLVFELLMWLIKPKYEWIFPPHVNFMTAHWFVIGNCWWQRSLLFASLLLRFLFYLKPLLKRNLFFNILIYSRLVVPKFSLSENYPAFKIYTSWRFWCIKPH